MLQFLFTMKFEVKSDTPDDPDSGTINFILHQNI